MESNRSENLLQIQDLTKIFTIRQGLSTSRLVAVDKARFAVESANPENSLASA